MKYRSDLVILLDILEAIDEDGSLISHIASHANMPHPRVKEKLDIMVKNGLITEEIDDEGKRIYKITRKGIEVRRRIKEIVYMLKELGLLKRED